MSGAATGFLQIARVLKSNGTEGEILVGFRGIDPEDLNVKEPVFIEFDGLPVPFYIESFNRRGTNRALMRITGVKNLIDAEELAGRDLFVRKDAVEEYSGKEAALTMEELEGWRILDQDGTGIGVITGFEDIPGNPCVYVETCSGQSMVPVHNELILAIDEERQTITLQVPEGLI